MKKAYIVLGSLIVAVVLLTVVRAVVSNSLATNGITLTEIARDIEQLERENALRQEKILQASSYTVIREAADAKGFEEASSQITLSGSLPIALKQ